MSDETTAAEAAAPQAEAPAPTPTGYNPEDTLISIDDFMNVKLRVAEVIEAAVHPNADKLLVLQVQIGERRKQICAGIKRSYSPEALIGKRIIIVDNLKPVTLRGVESQGMLLAASDDNGVYVLTCDKADIANGTDIR